MPVDNEALERLRRLRSLGVRKGARELRPANARDESAPAVDVIREPFPSAAAPAPGGGALPGESLDTPFGPVWVSRQRYRLAERPDLAQALAIRPETAAVLARDARLAAWAPATAAFLDTETTGLDLGAGTYTFLIGIGSYILDDPDGPCFMVEQFFMRHPAEERAQLYLVEQALERCTGLVSFNGRSFDVPLLQNRFIMARLSPPMPGAPHLDLLPPARRLWRACYGSCSLSSLEHNVLGLQRSEEDVPGWLIPTIYRDYYRGGPNAVLMPRVFYHNLQDITSMALLAPRMAIGFAREGLAEHLAHVHPLECAGLARCYQALDWVDAGAAAYRSALGGSLPDSDRLEVLRDLAILFKRAGRRSEAAGVWEEWINSVPLPDLTPYVELAKHHEWHTRDLAAARGWAACAIHIGAQQGQAAGDERLAELRHRLARLERKLAGESDADGVA